MSIDMDTDKLTFKQILALASKCIDEEKYPQAIKLLMVALASANVQIKALKLIIINMQGDGK